jgi:hypothetical protein
LERVESAKEWREKAENKRCKCGAGIEIRLYEPIEPVRPVLSHDFGIVITATFNNFLAFDELKERMRSEERERRARNRPLDSV